jgi:NAD(P)-dependent dehydrogenase (short-subunit alcohol dehydrogenase family)
MAGGLFEGRVAVVTGGASGIGLAAVKKLAAEGAKVCIADMNAAGAEVAAEQIAQAGGEAFACKVDVRDAAQNEAMVRETLERYGALHLAHLNAGIAQGSTIVDGDLEIWHNVIAVNLTGVYLGLRAVAPALIRAGGGAIVATASVAGLRGAAGMPSYYASKHGVVGLVKAAALELVDHWIRVNAVCPALTDTPMLGPAYGVKEITEGMLGPTHPMNRIAQPEEIAEMVVFLLSDKASFTTGCAYPVDGGMTAPPGGRSGNDAKPEMKEQFDKLMEGLSGGKQS